jgi:hypothetical protein
MSPNRPPGYSPFKIFDAWFCRGVQSAIFHYATCQDYKNWKSAKQRSKATEKAAKAREAEQAIISEQPRPIPQLQPLPFETNKGWLAEIKMGRDFDPAKAKQNRRVSSGNTRPRADTGNSDRYDSYRAKNPQSNDQSPPIVSRLPPPERKHEVAWMKAPPPSRAIMEGKENPAEDAPQRWPLCIIERTREELEREKRSVQEETPKSKTTQQSLVEDAERTPEELKCAKRSVQKEMRKKRSAAQNQGEYIDRELVRRIKREEAQEHIYYMTPAQIASLAAELPQKPTKAHIASTPRLLRRQKENTEVDSLADFESFAEAKSTRMCSWESAWDSEPAAEEYEHKWIGRPRGKPRISSLVAMQKGNKLQIRGASYNYDLFWKHENGSYTS